MTEVIDHDRQQLNEMGYAQELKRGMGWFSNFAISFSIISILAGGMTAYWLGMVTGGPMVITLGWLIVGFFVLLVGMAMGEICSAYPTAGGLYYWSAKLARKNGPRWSWFTGWFNLLGQIGVIASVDYALAVFIAYFIRMFDDGYRLTVLGIFGIFVLVLIAHGLLNTFGVSVIRILGDISVWWHVVGVVIIFFILMIAPDQHPWPQLGVRSGAARAHRMDGWGVRRGVPLRARSPAGAVHDHRLRCLGARQRRDRRRPHGGAEGHRQVDLRVGDRRLLPEPGDDPGDPGRPERIRSPSRSGTPTTRSWSTPHHG